ncbi:MAG: malonyl CoA-acyl carrier protein transacylase, partial [Actinomycetota bacterium]|nr:malonyl CoA-acyl carrier protein transacylase [Actinomycetota bacterium]
PRVPLYANASAAPAVSAEDVRQGLIRQVTAQVRWSESVTAMARAGASAFVELSPGRTLTGLARRIAPEVEALSADGPSKLDELAAGSTATGG